MKILVIGPVGSGKSTQGKFIASSFKLAFVSAGELLRQKAQEQSEDGKVAKEAIEKGQLVEGSLMGRLVKEQAQQNEGFVLDGYPRRLDQLQYFDPRFDKVFYLHVPDEAVIKRMLKRGRADDTEEVIKERLKIYHQQTEPVLEYYQKQGKLIKIDGSKSIEEVSKDIELNLK